MAAKPAGEAEAWEHVDTAALRVEVFLERLELKDDRWTRRADPTCYALSGPGFTRQPREHGAALVAHHSDFGVVRGGALASGSAFLLPLAKVTAMRTKLGGSCYRIAVEYHDTSGGGGAGEGTVVARGVSRMFEPITRPWAIRKFA